MLSFSSKHRGLAILPEVFGRPVRHAPLGAMPRKFQLMLLVVLVPPALAALYLRFISPPNVRFHDPLAHGLLEGFCALIVFYVLRQEWKLSGGRRLCIMAHGFLLYGILNLGHAAAPHHSNSFVFLHSIAGFALAACILASSVEEGERQNCFSRWNWESQEITLAFGIAGLAIACVGVMLAEYVPWRRVDDSFTVTARSVNTAAAVMFGFAGWIFLRDFRRSREPILFIFGLCMLAFSEIHTLFMLSRLWDVTWWAWHVVKALIYLGMLFGIAYECAQVLKDLYTSNEALRSSHLTLEQGNRDLQAACAQLASAQTSLVRAERLAALGQMAGMVAHEIRNPLGTITNCLGILKRSDLSAQEAARALALAENQADRLDQIVTDTLNSARTQVVRWQPVAPASVMDELLASCQGQALGGVLLKVDVPRDLPFVDGSPQQLHQVLWNLVVNAAEALDGPGEIRIGARADRGFVVFDVSDTGPGIPDELRERVFEPLFTTKPGGTGLGLAVVRKIVMDHYGTVEIESTELGGTKVTIRLPEMTQVEAETRQAAE